MSTPETQVAAADFAELPRTAAGGTGQLNLDLIMDVRLVLTLDVWGLAVATAVLVICTLYGELRSINTMVERAPGLRHLDSFGRTHRA